MSSSSLHVGVLTGGGDCPGLNAVIRGVTKSLLRIGARVTGIERGFMGMIERRSRLLDTRAVAFDEYCKVQFTDKKDREKRIRETGLNYTDGSSTKIAAYHPAKIRHGGD